MCSGRVSIGAAGSESKGDGVELMLRCFHREMEEPSRSTSPFFPEKGRTALVSKKKFLAGNSNDFK